MRPDPQQADSTVPFAEELLHRLGDKLRAMGAAVPLGPELLVAGGIGNPGGRRLPSRPPRGGVRPPFYVPLSTVGAPEGVAPLANDGKVPAEYLPAGGGSLVRVDHGQSTPAVTWTVNHNLGRRPHTEVYDPAGQLLLADVEHPDVNTVVITHAEPAAGSVVAIG